MLFLVIPCPFFPRKKQQEPVCYRKGGGTYGLVSPGWNSMMMLPKQKQKKQKFLDIVNRILQQQISTSSIYSFTLWFSNPRVQCPSEDLNALICHVLEQKVQKLSIKQTSLERLYDIKRVSVFPSAVFNSRSLIELDISMPTSLRFPSSNCLTNLKVLRFLYIDFFGDCFSGSEELMLSFPILKVFKIDVCKFFDLNGLIIDTPMLESFVVRYPVFKERLENEWSSVSRTINLSALGLKKFYYYGGVEEDIILSNPLIVVVDVFLNVLIIRVKDDQRCVKAHMLLKEFHESVKFLEVRPFMTPTLARLKDDSLLRLPIFKSLVSLVLARASDELLKLVKKSSNLQRLELKAGSSTFGSTLSSSVDVRSLYSA